VTGLWLYAYVVLPIIVVAMGYGAMRLVERRDDGRHPAE
jgi:hypothetical protein